MIHPFQLDSGMYIGWVKGLIGVDDFFENIGYIQEDNYMVLQRPPPIQHLELVCLNIRLGMIQCFIAHHIHQRLSYTHHHTTLPQVMLMLQNYNPQPCVPLFSPPHNSFTSHFNHNLPPKPPSFFKNQPSLFSLSSSQHVTKKVTKVPPPVPKKNFHLTPSGLTHSHYDTQQSGSEISDNHPMNVDLEGSSQDTRCQENFEYNSSFGKEIQDDENNLKLISKNDEKNECIVSDDKPSGDSIVNDSLKNANDDTQQGHHALISQKCDLVVSLEEATNNYYNMAQTNNNNNSDTYINHGGKNENTPGQEKAHHEEEKMSENNDYVNEGINVKNDNVDSEMDNPDKTSFEYKNCGKEQTPVSIHNITSYQNNSYFDICNLGNESTNKNDNLISSTNNTIGSSGVKNSNLDNYQNSERIFNDLLCEKEDFKNIKVSLNNSNNKTELINNDFVAYSSLQECHMSDNQNIIGRLDMNEKIFRIQATEKWIKDNEYNCFKKSSGEEKYIRPGEVCEMTQQNIQAKDLESINKGIYYGFPKVSVGKEDLLYKSEEKFTGTKAKIEAKSDERVRFIAKMLTKDDAKNELEDKQAITFSTFKKSTEDLSQPLPPPPPPPLMLPHLYSNISAHHHHYPPPPPPPVQHHHPQCKHYHQRPPPLPPTSQVTRNSEGSLINQLILKKFMHDDSSDV